MGRRPESSALSALSALERGEVLSFLLRAHPSLVAEAERVAAGLLRGADRERAAGDVAGALRALYLRDLAERAGPQRGGGYVDPSEAADELLAEVVEPYLDDLDRRARRQARGAAAEIGLGLLLGLYSCRDWRGTGLSCRRAGWPRSAPEDDAERVVHRWRAPRRPAAPDRPGPRCGAVIRKELNRRHKQWAAQLAVPVPAVRDDAPFAVDELVSLLVPGSGRRSAKKADVARLTLALPGEPDTPPPWTPQAEVARRLRMAQPSVSRHQKALFEEWAATPWLEQVRDELVELLAAAGRVSTAHELTAALRAVAARPLPRPTGPGRSRRRWCGPRSRPRSGQVCMLTTRRSATAAHAWRCSGAATPS